MPSSTKERSKEDTWKETELKKSLKDANDENRRDKERNRERRDRDKDRERRRREDLNGKDDRKDPDEKSRHRDHKDSADDRHRRRENERREGSHRDKDRSRERNREKDRSRERNRDKDRSRERKERDSHGSSRHDENKDRRHRDRGGQRRTREQDDSQDTRHSRSKDEEREKRHRDRKEKIKENEDASSEDRRHSKHRDETEQERERRRERRRNEKQDENDEERKNRRDKDKEKSDRHRREDREKSDRHRRDDKEKSERRRKDDNREESDRHNRDSHREDRANRGERDKDRDKRSDRHRNDRENDEGHHRDRDRHRERDSRHGENEAEEDVPDVKNKDRRDRNKSRERGRDKKDQENDKQGRGRDSNERQKERREADRDDKSRKKHDDSSEKPERKPQTEDTIHKPGTKETNQSKKEKKPVKTEEVADDYEDDFEDYDDDFEDFDEEEELRSKKPNQSVQLKGMSPRLQEVTNWHAEDATNAEMEDVLKAMAEENDRLLVSSRNSQKSSSSDNSNDMSEEKVVPRRKAGGKMQTTKGRTFINFVSAKQRQVSEKVASKTRKRGQELLSMLELDAVTFDIFDMPPVREYEMYIRSFGATNTQQAYVQTNEDNLDRDIQTDDIECREKWTQHPAEAFQAVGGGDGEMSEDENGIRKHVDSINLSKFLLNATQVIHALLEEEQISVQLDAGDLKIKSSFSFSGGIINLKTPAFLQGSSVIYSQFSAAQNNLFITAYDTVNNVNSPFHNKGIICVWNTKDPSRPQKVLVSESRPVCCCFSPFKASLVFAGMTDGSIEVWDLREPDCQHRRIDQHYVARYPTYSTAGILNEDGEYENHQSPILSLVPVVSSEDRSKSTGNDDSVSGLSFQLASLEQSAILHMWVVAEVPFVDAAGSESDLGLAPGGCIKLLKSSSLKLDNPYKGGTNSSLQTYQIALLPSDANHFYVTTDSGCVIHGVRYGGRAPPKAYLPLVECPVIVNCIDFSPFNQPCFLVGCKDGALRLYHLNLDTPLIDWSLSTNSQSIEYVKWSQSCPSMFYVLDSESNLYTWDLNQSDAIPIKTERHPDKLIRCISLSVDSQVKSSGSSNRPQIAMGFENGDVELHLLSSRPQSIQDDLLQFSELLDRAV